MIPTSTTWQGRIVHGKVVWRDREGVQRFIAGLEGKRVLITIDEHHGRRTLSQNAYSHVVYEYIAEETGYEPLEVKDLMKRLFLCRPDRRGRMRVRGTSKLNRREFSAYLEAVIRWAAIWLEITVPPAEQCVEAWKDD